MHAVTPDCRSSPQLLTQWTLIPDPDQEGNAAGWSQRPPAGGQEAFVPGTIQQVFPGAAGVFWYYAPFQLAAQVQGGDRVLLRFGAVDYRCEVWVNGSPVGGHEGGETPFSCDITAALAANGNLVAVRVLVPVNEPIDGVRLAETPHRNKTMTYAPGSGPNYGGIMLPVDLLVVPAVSIADLFARPDRRTGVVDATLTIHSNQEQAADVQLSLLAAPASSGSTVAILTTIVHCTPGVSSHELTLTIPSPRSWSLAEPTLYRLTASIGAGAQRHDLSIRFGFREVALVDGFFHLNDQRIYLRSTHTGNHVPVSVVAPGDHDFLRRDLLMAKSAGYNVVRFIAGLAWPEQLDLCDEIGLLVYEESMAAWCLGDSPYLGERFDRSVREMILRDRNHPCVAMWGLLNETPANATFRHAVGMLPLVRAHDPTRLVLLASGRWDGELGIGSASNPGSLTWEHVWGQEAPGAASIPFAFAWEPAAGFAPGLGDIHIYPKLPLEARHEPLIRDLGTGGRPAFLSEYGVGSLFNAVEELKGYDALDVRDDLTDRSLIRSMSERLQSDWSRWGMDRVYPFPEDFLRESSRHMARQRRASFDLIRANPRICGYNLTGMLDHAFTGEGLWSFWRRWKPGVPEMIQAGWAPLRWCLFVRPRHGYTQRPLEIEAVLASDGVLRPGTYPVRLKIFSAQRGAVWEHATTVTMPDGPANGRPFAVPVFHGRLSLDLPAGDYTLAACLERGGIAAEDRLLFQLSTIPTRIAPAPAVGQLGLTPTVIAWLQARGVVVHPFQAQNAVSVILIGDPGPGTSTDTWAEVRDAVHRGANAVFLSERPFLAKEASQPLPDLVSATVVHDWLYHQDTIATAHPVLAGVQAPGLMDWDRVGAVMGHTHYAMSATAEASDPARTVIAASFGVGMPCAGGYLSGLMLAEFVHGQGRCLLNGMRVLEHIDIHPMADRLLLNLLQHAAGTRA